MKPGQPVQLTAGTIWDMSEEQLHALKSLCMPGAWDHLPNDFIVHATGTDPLGVHMNGMFIGIEKDGYTHS